MADVPLLDVRNVTKRFGGVTANTDVTFNVCAGEIVGLVGPNGAGKTSIFNSIAGEVTPDSGEVLLDGKRISGLGPVACAKAGIARTFQVVRSFDSMTVLENVMVGAFSRFPRTRESRAEATRILAFTGLGPKADTPALRLSPPEKRRLEIARALATGPRIILLDETLTGLTPTEAASGVALVRKVRDQGIAVMMVEHVMEVLLPLIDRAVVLDLGRVLMQGSPREMVRHPEVIQAYLGARYAG